MESSKVPDTPRPPTNQLETLLQQSPAAPSHLLVPSQLGVRQMHAMQTAHQSLASPAAPYPMQQPVQQTLTPSTTPYPMMQPRQQYPMLQPGQQSLAPPAAPYPMMQLQLPPMPAKTNGTREEQPVRTPEDVRREAMKLVRQISSAKSTTSSVGGGAPGRGVYSRQQSEELSHGEYSLLLSYKLSLVILQETIIALSYLVVNVILKTSTDNTYLINGVQSFSLSYLVEKSYISVLYYLFIFYLFIYSFFCFSFQGHDEEPVYSGHYSGDRGRQRGHSRQGSKWSTQPNAREVFHYKRDGEETSRDGREQFHHTLYA